MAAGSPAYGQRVAHATGTAGRTQSSYLSHPNLRSPARSGACNANHITPPSQPQRPMLVGCGLVMRAGRVPPVKRRIPRRWIDQSREGFECPKKRSY